MKEFNVFRYTTEQIDTIVQKVCELVEDDAKALLAGRLYNLAYKCDEIGAVFNQRLVPIIKELTKN